MKYIIIIEDSKNGVSAQHMPNPTIAELAYGIPETPAGELAEFLKHAADVWQEAQHMTPEQTRKFLQSITLSAPTQAH